MIDYVFYTRDVMRPLGILGPLDPDWFVKHKVRGCPHPHIPSDHLPLLVEIEMKPMMMAGGAAGAGGARAALTHGGGGGVPQATMFGSSMRSSALHGGGRR